MDRHGMTKTEAVAALGGLAHLAGVDARAIQALCLGMKALARELVHKGRNRAARKARAAEAAPKRWQRELGNIADILICLATEMTKAGESDAAAKCCTAGYAILDARNIFYPPEGEDNERGAAPNPEGEDTQPISTMSPDGGLDAIKNLPRPVSPALTRDQSALPFPGGENAAAQDEKGGAE